MTQQSSLIDRETATDIVISLRNRVLEQFDTVKVDISQGIAGRTLAETITAETDQPSVDRATMDGYAIDATEEYPHTLLDETQYPEDEVTSIQPGEAVPITTGAPLPAGANAVLKMEDATVTDGMLSGEVIEPGTYTYAKGSNLTAGETIYQTGDRLSPRDAILLRDVGRETITVYRPFSVGLLATGTEIHENKIPDLDSPMLADLLRSWGASPTIVGSVPDGYDQVKEAIAELVTTYDVVVTTGGTSVGDKDFVIEALGDIGTVHFHRVRVRPGKPIAVGWVPETETVVFAIPGKPIGAHTIATLIMRPFFTGTDIQPAIPSTMARDVAIGPAAFEYAIPVEITDDGAMPYGHTDSPLRLYDETFNASVLSSSTRASRADGIILAAEDIQKGDPVDVIPYAALE